MDDYKAIKNIPTKEERDAVALALIHACCEVRLTKRKDGSRTMVDVEYRERGKI